MKLLHTFCEINNLNARQVTTTLGGLARLRLRWDFLSKQTREDLMKAMSVVAIRLNDREVGNILHSCSKLNIPWEVFPGTVRSDLLESFVRNSKKLISQQGSMAIYSLGAFKAYNIKGNI
jgi:hypothetical protein